MGGWLRGSYSVLILCLISKATKGNKWAVLFFFAFFFFLFFCWW